MRAFILLCCATVFSFTPHNVLSQNAKIKIDVDKTVSIDEVFDIITAQTDYAFIYHEDLFKGLPKIQLKKGTIRANKLLQDSFVYDIFNVIVTANNGILIKERTRNDKKLQLQISGNVSDTKGLPVSGATVLIKGTSKGTVTDIDGNYNITVLNPENVLVFSSMGFKTQEVTVNNKNLINIILQEDASELGEVVLIGYGSLEKRDVNSAIESVKGEEIFLPATNSVDRLLGGRIPGLVAVQTSGKPGSGAIVNIRGVSSFNGANQPLYVVDGVPLLVEDNFPNYVNNGLGGVPSTNPLELINPADIENIDVLKDAAATSIYGSRGANGVILITTKRGRKNQKPQVNLSYIYSQNQPVGTYDVLDLAAYKDAMISAARATFKVNPNNALASQIVDPATGEVKDGYFLNGDTNWQDVVTRDRADVHTLNISLTGGGDNNNYFFSLGRAEQEGVYISDDYLRHTIRGTFDADILKNFKAGGGLSYQTSTSDTGAFSTFDNVFFTRPDQPVRNEDGTLFLVNENDSGNLLAYAENSRTTSLGLNFSGNAYGELTILKNFKVRSAISSTVAESDVKRFFGYGYNDRTDYNNRVVNATWENTLSYNKIHKNHNFNILLGNTFDLRKVSVSGREYQGLPSPDFFDDSSLSEDVSRIFEYNTDSRLQSYFGRVNYSFDNRYYLTVTNRADGYSKFGPNNRWAYFPSAALAWRVSNESFMESLEFVDDLKFRFSIGRSGNANLPDFANQRFYGVAIDEGPTHYGDNIGLGLTGIADESIGWEVTEEKNFGLDISLLESKLALKVDYFDKSTTSMITFLPLLPSSGYSDQLANSESLIANKGWEIGLDMTVLKNKYIEWRSSFNISFVENTIERFNGSLYPGFNFGLPEGSPLGAINAYVVDGIFKSQEEIDNHPITQGNPVVGDLKFKDLNGDNRISGLDRKIVGDVQPDYYGGWNNSIRIKDFEVGVNFQFSVGAEKIWAPSETLTRTFFRGGNITKEMLENSWTPGKGNTKYPELRLATSPNFRSFSNFSSNVEDASFLRLRTLSLRYNIPQKFLEKFNVSRASVFTSANNVVTWTNYSGIDPEGANSSNVNVGSINSNRDQNPYPLSRTISWGLNVSF